MLETLQNHIASEDGITFNVANVAGADSLLETVNSVRAVTNQTGVQPEACSDYSTNYVAGISSNPFAAAIKLAHDQHRPLVLSPDGVWLAICQGLSIHIEENWDSLKHLILDPESKEATDAQYLDT